jgi:hypothetical protein
MRRPNAIGSPLPKRPEPESRVATHPARSEQDRRPSGAAKARAAVATLTTPQPMEKRYG